MTTLTPQQQASNYLTGRSGTPQQQVAQSLGVSTGSINPNVNVNTSNPTTTVRRNSGGGSSGGGSSQPSVTYINGLPEQEYNRQKAESEQRQQLINQQKSYDASGGVQKINSQQSVSIGLSASDIQRRNDLRNAGFSNEDIVVLTSNKGSSYTFYNGKVVPQTSQQKAFQEQADAQGKDLEKRTSDTLVSLGITTLGLGLAPASAAAGGAISLAGVIGGNILSAFGLVDTGKNIAGLQGVEGSKKITVKEQEEVIREIENRVNDKYSTDSTMNLAVVGDVPNVPLPFVGSTKNILYGLFGSKITSEVVQGLNKKETGLQEFENMGKQVLLERGYNEKDAESNARFLRGVSFGGEVGFVASLFPAGGIGEYGVRTGVQKSVSIVNAFESKAAAAEAAKIAAQKSATVPSIIEGVTLYALSQRSRDGEIKPEGVILSGIGSGVTGRYGAGWMAETSILNPAKANLVYKSSWLLGQTDEPAGDLFTDLLMKGVNKPTDVKVKYFVPTVTVSTTGSSGGNVGGSGSVGKASNAGATSAKDFLLNNSQTVTDPFGLSNSNSQSFSQSQGQSFAPSTTNTTTISNTKGDTITYNNSFSNSFTDTSSQSQTNTNSFTESTTFTHSVNLPFIPLGGGFGLNAESFGGGGASAKSKRKYYDEWGAAFGILARQTPRYVESSNKKQIAQRKKILNQELKELNKRKPRQVKPFTFNKNLIRGFL